MGTTRTRSSARRAALTLTLVATLAACGSGGGDPAGPGADGGSADAGGPFKGKTVDFVVPYEPGGGYDAYARAIAPYLGDCLGARVVVRNEPGAGGLVATNKTAASPPSSNRIQITNTVGLVAAQIAGAQGATFDLADFSWIGRVSAPPNVLVVGKDSKIESFQDIATAKEPLRFVATGPGSNDYINPNILSRAYGFPAEVITGFAGSGEARAAVIAGNADAHILPIDSQLGAIKSGDVRPVVTIDEERDPLLPDTPPIYDTLPTAEGGRAIVENLVAMSRTGRSIVAPPKTDEERLRALREGFQCAVGDEKLVNELESQRRPLNPLGGAETAQLVEKVLTSPEEFQAMVKESF